MILKPIKTQIYKQNIKLSQYMLNIANECKDDKVKIYRIMKLWCIYIQVHKNTYISSIIMKIILGYNYNSGYKNGYNNTKNTEMCWQWRLLYSYHILLSFLVILI